MRWVGLICKKIIMFVYRIVLDKGVAHRIQLFYYNDTKLLHIHLHTF